MGSGGGHTSGYCSEAFPWQYLLCGCPRGGARPCFPDTLLSSSILESKNSTIKDLQYELAKVCKVREAPIIPSPRSLLILMSGC